MKLFEFHDQKWFPGFLRDDVTEALQFIFRIGGIYRHSASRLKRAFQTCKASRVVDLCSGGSGPWPWLHQSLHDRDGQYAEVCLTDKYPNTAAFRRIQQESHGAITYRPESVDATSVPAELLGFRTLFTAFHHFPRQQAVSILQDAVDQRQGIAVFEAPRCHPVTMALNVLVLFGGFVTAPFIRPFRASRLFWTYLLPVIPLVLFYDGLVSCFRAYSLKQLLEMTASVHADGYVWEVGEETGGFATVTYLLGYPVK
jgi:hypothetical protein